MATRATQVQSGVTNTNRWRGRNGRCGKTPAEAGEPNSVAAPYDTHEVVALAGRQGLVDLGHLRRGRSAAIWRAGRLSSCSSMCTSDHGSCLILEDGYDTRPRRIGIVRQEPSIQLADSGSATGACHGSLGTPHVHVGIEDRRQYPKIDAMKGRPLFIAAHVCRPARATFSIVVRGRQDALSPDERGLGQS